MDEGVSPVLLQLLSCALCGSKVLAALAASTGSSSAASSSAPAAAGSGQAATQSKSSTKKSKKEEKEKEKDGEGHCGPARGILPPRVHCLGAGAERLFTLVQLNDLLVTFPFMTEETP